MTHHDTLVSGLATTHAVLRHRLDQAATSHPDTDPTHPRDQYPATDTFLASTSRHLAAVTSVLLPAARRRLPDGRERAREFVQECRRLEVALNSVKAKLYGSTYAVRRTWTSIWSDVRRELDVVCELERALATDLAAHHRDDDPDWAQLLYGAELKAPTRPHPYLPHQGVSGRTARVVARGVDRFWDTAEGRMMPEPVHHHERRDQGPITQYLLADPHLPGDD